MITEGALEGVNLCTQLLSETGDIAWIEDPGYAGAKSAFAKSGLTMVGMPVDEEGMRLETEGEHSPTLIFTSPSHQFPYGSVLSIHRRFALLEFARQHNAWIIEDDYDSEFRYSGEPVPAMMGMQKNAPVVYLGTFSKTLFPSLRIGFMVMPKALANAAQPAIGSLLRVGIVLSSARWRCLSKRGITPDILPRCGVCTASAINSCAMCFTRNSMFHIGF